MKQKVLETLDRLHIPYEYEDHPAAYTMEEIEALHLTRPNESIAKNLFLRDGSGKRHFLVLAAGDKPVDLKTLRQTIGSIQTITLPRCGSVVPIWNRSSATTEILLHISLSKQSGRPTSSPGTSVFSA